MTKMIPVNTTVWIGVALLLAGVLIGFKIVAPYKQNKDQNNN